MTEVVPEWTHERWMGVYVEDGVRVALLVGSGA